MLFAKDEKEEIEALDKLINYHKVRLILLNNTKVNDNRVKYLDSKKIHYITLLQALGLKKAKRNFFLNI